MKQRVQIYSLHLQQVAIDLKRKREFLWRQVSKHSELRRHRLAFKMMSFLASTGDTDAIFGLGCYFEEGYGVRKDKRHAFLLYQSAASYGNVEGLFSVGRCLCLGKGVRKNIKLGVEFLKLSSRRGDIDSKYQIGLVYSRSSDPRMIKDSVRWFRSAARLGHVDSAFSLGFAYSSGRGTPIRKRLAKKWYKKAAEGGDADAQHNLDLLSMR